MNFGHIKNIHFIGIGGIGMSGIAEILTNYELKISGCDIKASSVSDRLLRNGVDVVIGHDPSHVAKADLVVISSAVRRDNPEVRRARELKVPVIRRAEMLGEITRLKNGVAIAGTHGKTTTSAMTGMVLAEGGLDPTLIIGGVLRNLDSNAKLGQGEYLVVEADEYDRSFLTLHPTISVITNIEADHLDCYRDLDDIRTTFAEFASRVPFFGAVIGCIDDENVAALIEQFPKRAIGYGLSERAEIRASNMVFQAEGARFDVTNKGKLLGTVSLRVPGIHNVRNALAAIAVGLELEVPFANAVAALAKFTGVERRFQILGEFNGAMIVDDYAHHPTEIHATLDAARRGYPERRLVALFQPHLYSRTRDFYEDFARSLSIADVAIVAPIFPAREEPIEGVTSGLIVDAAARQGWVNVQLIDMALEGIVDSLRRTLSPRDLLLTMGAGDVHRVGEMLSRDPA